MAKISPKKKPATAKKATTPKKPRRSWDDNYQLLVAFHKQNGHANVAVRYPPDITLGRWVGKQRTNQHRLSTEQRSKLMALGFAFDCGSRLSLERLWDTRFQELVEFQSIHGHCLVPLAKVELGEWVHNQRQRYRKKTLRPDRVQKLESIGFVWNARPCCVNKSRASTKEDIKWHEKYRELQEFVRQQQNGSNNNNSSVVISLKNGADPSLVSWMDHQRVLFSQNLLRHDRKTLLYRMGLTLLRPVDEAAGLVWEKRFASLLAHQRQFGNATPHRAPKSEQQELVGWAESQTVLFRNGEIEPDRACRLLSVGFPYIPEIDRSWDFRFRELKQLRGRKETELGTKIERWVELQRVLILHEHLSPERQWRIESIGFGPKIVTV